MSTDNNHDRWKEGSTVEDGDYEIAPAGVVCANGDADCPGYWLESLGSGVWLDSNGEKRDHRGLWSCRYIIQRPENAQAAQVQPATGVADKNAGRKDDAGKNRLDLLPPHALWEIGQALTFGAKKYGDENWRKVADAKARYTAALFRHIVKWMCGERNDADSGLHHLAHAGACVLFLLDVEVKS